MEERASRIEDRKWRIEVGGVESED